ncbi:hypothetical protein T12_395 [Trichinella patagoniensis]|uniref:Uncharacterized protein n=1 Tax=Trichinella patagoniensis TaxID=990121 RepID=A0A0V0Z7W1_9BILA|nr:hypothetical protein T12_395 [Trichinella patagoniensis]
MVILFVVDSALGWKFRVVCVLSAVPNPVDTDYLVLSVIAAYLNCCWAQVLADCPSNSPLRLELAASGVPDPKVGCRPEASVAFVLRDRTAPFSVGLLGLNVLLQTHTIVAFYVPVNCANVHWNSSIDLVPSTC